MKSTKTENPVEAEVVSKETKTYPKDTWSVNRLFWGMLFVVIGGLMLAANFNYVEVHWLNLWRLWPLLIIAFGLSILSIKHWLWKLASVLMIIATMFAIVWVSVIGDIYVGKVIDYSATVSTISSRVKKAEINITAGASSLNIDSADQAAIAKANLKSNITDIKKSSRLSGSTQQIELSMNPLNDSQWWSGDIKSVFDIDVCKYLPISVNLDAGASSTKIDLSLAKLSSMNIKAGASDLDIKVGDKMPITKIDIDSGVSSIVIRVPKSSGVQVVMDGGLTSKNMADLKKINDDQYESLDYIDAINKIEISAQIGMSSFTIERY